MAKNTRKLIKQQLQVIVNDLGRSMPRYALIIDKYLPYSEPIESVIEVINLIYDVMAQLEDSNLEVVYRMLVADDVIDDLGVYWREIISVGTLYKTQIELQQNVIHLNNKT